jgi:hypothetical protein
MSLSVRKNLLSTLYVIGGFLLLALLFSYPALQGKILASSDTLNWKWVSEEARAWHEKTGEQILWSNSMMGGMPSYTFYGPQGSNLLSHLHNGILGFLPRPANFLFLAMVCFFVLMSVMRVNKWLGAAGAIAYAFATYNCVITATGHETKMIDIAYMPAVVAGLVLLMRGRDISGAALFGISLSLALLAGHYQIVYYMMFVLLFAGIGMLIEAYKAGKVKQALTGGVISLALIGIAMGSNLGIIMPTMEYTAQTQRGGASQLHIHDQGKKSGGLDKTYAFSWSNGIGETFCILVPYLYGGSSREDATRLPQTYEGTGEQYPELPAYWGPQPILMGPVYFGAIVCFLFVLGMMLIRNPVKWWLFAIAIFGILLSVGDHFKAFNYFLFDYLPGLNKFRAPSTALVIPQLIFPVIGIWGLNEVLRGKVNRAELWKKARIAAVGVGGLALAIALLGSLFFDFTNKTGDAQMPAEILNLLKEDRQAMARNSGLLSALYIAATAGLIWLFAKDRIKAHWFVGCLALLIAADLLPVGYNYLRDMPGNPSSPYLNKEDYEARFAPTPADQQILADKDPYYRVLDVTRGAFSDAKTSFFHKSIGGYSAAKLENYQDLIDVHMSKGFNTEVLNMLNTRYVIVPGGRAGGEGVIPNPNALGNGWFVSNIKWATSAEDEINALNAPSLGDTLQVPNAFNAQQTAVLRDTYRAQLGGFTPSKDSAAAIRLTKYGLNDLAFESSNPAEGLGVFSDIYYDKGWKAYIDGKESPILRANYVLRALCIPAGNHKIEFRFMPESYVMGKTVALICSVLLLCIAILWAVMYFRKKQGEPKAAV